VSAAAEGEEAHTLFPVLDLNNERVRKNLIMFLVFTTFSIVVLGSATYKGVHIMDSVAFCGTVCHTVMQPEYVAHQRSPHARVACADCHIGPGADWFVKSKISGSWQLIAVALNIYPTRDLRAMPLADKFCWRLAEGAYQFRRRRDQQPKPDIGIAQGRRIGRTQVFRNPLAC
jgi:hypothetical protein